MNIFITGINQGCGKTILSAGIAALMQSLGYQTGVYKPIQTGALDEGNYLTSPDLTLVKNIDAHIITHTTYLLTSTSTPAAACELESIDFNLEDIENDYKILSRNTELLITEGTGGLLNPIKDDLYNIQIPLTLNLPILFVVTPSNDSLNACLNELNTARKAGLDVIGVIINKYPLHSKSSEIATFPLILQRYGKVKIMGIIRNFKSSPIKPNTLFNELLNSVNLQEVLRMEIPKLNMY